MNSKVKSFRIISFFAIVILTIFIITACDNETDSDTTPQSVAKPTATPAGGNYTTAQTVTLATGTSGADIYYTLNGTAPTTSSAKYSSPITISTTSTLKAIAVKKGMTNSEILAETYTITLLGKVVQPTATPAGGNYTSAQTVTLATGTSGADIHYTLNGTTPTTSSTKYSSPITISTTSTLKAIAVKTGMTNSEILTETYTVIVPSFPSSFRMSWIRDNFSNTLTFTATTLKASNQNSTWNLTAVSGDSYTIATGTTSGAITIKLVSGNLEISGDSGTGENNWNGTWKLQNVVDVSSYLASLPANTVDNPVSLSVNINLGTMTAAGSGWQQLLDVINTAGKFVNLDLSSCTMSGTSFNPDSSVTTGKDRIASLVLPAAATSIEAGTTSNPTFRNFSNLKSISGVYVTTIGNYIFYNSSLSSNTTLQSADFPRATSIGDRAFSGCRSLQSVNFPQVTTISTYAFENCTSIQSINFLQVTSIGTYAFTGCTALQSASFPASAELGRFLTTYDNPFRGCTSLTSFTLIGTGSLSVIENDKALVRNGTVLLAYPSASGTVTLNTITSIDGSAFYGCTDLQSVSFPLATSIGGMAFYRCTGLTSANFPLATSIGVSAFYNCTVLQNVDFSRAESIGSSAFESCTALQSVSLPQTTSIGGMAFYRCTSLQSLNIPKVTSMGMFAFGQAGNTALSITMGSTAPTLAREIFTSVTSVKTVTVKVPNGATGYTPFSGSTVTVSGTDTTANWANGFRGGSWNGTTWADTSSGGTAAINQNISLIIERQ